MIARAVLAPGKALLCGEYAVLHGAPAIAVATDRVVRVRAGEKSEPSPFVDAALDAVAKLLHRNKITVSVDSSALFDGVRKLGLGSSAAVTAGVVGAAIVEAGGSLDDHEKIFAIADEAHGLAQGTRGSGVDVAASVYGGAIRFTRKNGAAEIRPVDLPDGVELTFVFTGKSASTAELIGRVKALAERDRARHDAAIGRLISGAHAFASAVDEADATDLIAAALDYGAALDALGSDAGCEIVTAELATLAAIARRHGGAGKPSGAGGGDLGVAFTTSPQATRALRDDLAAAGLVPLTVAAPAPGIRLETP